MSRSSRPLESSCVTLSVNIYVERDRESTSRLCTRLTCPILKARAKVSVHPTPYSIDGIAHQMGGVSFEVPRLTLCLCMSHLRTEVMPIDGSVQIQLAFSDKGVTEVFRRLIMSDIKVLDNFVETGTTEQQYADFGKAMAFPVRPLEIDGAWHCRAKTFRKRVAIETNSSYLV